MNTDFLNNTIDAYKKENVKLRTSSIKSNLLRVYNIYQKYVPNGEHLLSTMLPVDLFRKMDLIRDNILLGKGLKEQFILLTECNELGQTSYINYCKNKTKNMKAKVASDRRYYSMNLESFIFREGEVQGVISYNKFVSTLKNVSRRRVEYWEGIGYTKPDAIEQVKQHQSTFSKQKCIKKHGESKGIAIWKDRQNKWQNTLNSKPLEEQLHINYKKYPHRIDRLIEIYGENWKTIIYDAYNVSKEYQNYDIHEYLYHHIVPERMLHCNISRMLKTVPKYIWTLFGVKTNDDKIKCINDMLTKYNLKFHNSVKFINKSKIIRYHLFIPELDIILRSSNEIYFYNLLKKYNINFTSNLKYPNSNMWYDFHLTDYNLYIEISSFKEEHSPKYFNTIQKKKNLFNSIFISDPKTYDKFLWDLIYSNAAESNSTSISVSG